MSGGNGKKFIVPAEEFAFIIYEKIKI